ncbi:Sensor histidine kinase [Fulvivirga imtechensis AK7]|uniref:Sensor histidine kinase n=2 Tax=Fulvivirga TaxID=396811 RepID=L8JT02_9BACT|nr:Sensor histidine kinase [Fulvivirga imtechensis AK7]
MLKLGVYYRSRNFDTARYFYQRALEESQHHGYARGMVAAYAGAGVTYGMEGEYPQAIIHFEKALAKARESNIPDLVFNQYNSLGIVYKRLGDYPRSYEWYNKAMALADSLQDPLKIADNQFSIAVLHDMMDEPDKALTLLRESLKNYTKAGRPVMSNIYNSIGVILAKANNYDSALHYYFIALEMDRKVDKKEAELIVMNNIGNAYRKTKRYKEAEKILLDALHEAEKVRLNQAKADILYNLSKTYVAQRQTDLALEYALKMLDLSKSLGSFLQIGEAYEVLSHIFEQKQDNTTALKYYKDFKAYQDSLFNQNKTKEFKTQQTMFDVYKKDQELAKQELELTYLNEKALLDKKWKFMLKASSALLLFTLLLLYQRYRHRLRHNELLKSKNAVIVSQKQHIEEMNETLEKRMLRAQMNPHFIFNSLSSIQHFVTVNDKASALKYLTKFSNLLRSVLETSTGVQVTLAEEIELIKIYLELESLRFDNEFKYEIKVDQRLDIYNLEIPLLLIQPYIENAILHGLLPSAKEDKLLNVTFEATDNAMRVSIEDNGIGRKAAQVIKEKKGYKKQSLGMSVTQKRLEMLEKNKDTTAAVTVADLYRDNGEPEGTRIIINIPQPINGES